MKEVKLPIICRDCSCILDFHELDASHWAITVVALEKGWELNEKGWFCPNCRKKERNHSLFMEKEDYYE